MKRAIIYLLILAAIIPIASASPDTCRGARFCGESNQQCDYSGDGVCPENYGEWSSCRQNNYGKKCTPCDPDCGGCGRNIALDVPDSNASSSFLIKMDAYGYGIARQGDNFESRFYLVNGNDISLVELVTINSCPDNICPAQISRNSPDNNCKVYNYAVRFYERIWVEDHYETNIIGTVYDSGKTTPFVSITQDENSNFNVEASCNGDQGADARMVEFLIEKRKEDGSYAKINSQGEECDQNDCNRLAIRGQRQGNYFVFNFDNSNFDNGQYRMIASATAWTLDFEGDVYETYPESADSEEFTVDRGLAGETGGAYQGSKVLNIILAKVKTWI